MSIQMVNRLLRQKENIRLEFKEAKQALPNNLFETICAMLNRDGGDILLGVNDAGIVVGIDPSAKEIMVSNIVNLSNNNQKLDPPFILFPLHLEINGKHILHLQIPCSSQIHKSVGVVFDRSNDGDYRVTNPAQIADMYNKKRSHFSENTLYPFLQFSDFKSELFPKIRNLIRSNNPNHPWLGLSDEQLLHKAGLWKQDYQTGQAGYTLAAALLFGKDEVIQQILPYYKIDALVRIQDEYRYDDRLYIQTNLIEAYEQLMDFVARHLPDKFYQIGDQRISLRTHIFREIVANIIVHREYMNAHPCTFVISKGKVETENANNANGQGLINAMHFVPFPKNPTIAKFFIQLGRVDELGSGVINVNRFIQEYANEGKPTFTEGVTFKMLIPIPVVDTGIVSLTVNDGVNEGVNVRNDGVNEGVNVRNDGVNEGVNHGNSGVSEGVNLNDDGVNLTFDGAIDGAIDGATNGVKKNLITLLKVIAANEGIRVPVIKEATGLPDSSMERYIKQLKESGIIEFKGATKTGGYYLTEKMKAKLKK